MSFQSRLALACLLALAAFPALSQGYPSRPIRLIVPWPPTGTVDILGRTLGQKLGENMAQSVIIDNRAGANGIIGSDAGAKSPPDGYTLLAGGSAALAINPHLYPKLGYNTLRDFAPVTQIVAIAEVFVVNPALPVQNLDDYIRLAKQRPGELNYGSSGAGSTSHLVTAALATRAGITVNHVPYKGAVQALTDLIAGQLTLVAETPPTVIPHVQSKKIRPIAISMIKRIPQLPDVPTVDEQGIKGYDLNTWTSLVAPAGTPAAILDRLNADITNIIAQPEVQKRLVDMGFIPVGNSREQFGAFLKAEYANWAKIVQVSGAKAE
jgi:tripartite-type tricarboxylate transporter receptor subunit TctC